jgi:hypothetical protein
MAKKEQTSKKAATKASKLLKDNTMSSDVKSVAASALTQAPDKKKAPAKPAGKATAKKAAASKTAGKPSAKTSATKGAVKNKSAAGSNTIDLTGTTRVTRKKR